jgi:hypothetical protein
LHTVYRRKYQYCQYNLILCTYFFVADPLLAIRGASETEKIFSVG